MIKKEMKTLWNIKTAVEYEANHSGLCGCLLSMSVLICINVMFCTNSICKIKILNEQIKHIF